MAQVRKEEVCHIQQVEFINQDQDIKDLKENWVKEITQRVL